MRYIGSKESLLDFIEEAVRDLCGGCGSVADLFSGTASVARRFKSMGMTVIANDLMRFPHVLAHTYIQVTSVPTFDNLPVPHGPNGSLTRQERLSTIVEYLNSLALEPGYTARTYSPLGESGRMYLTAENASRVDTIRNALHGWRTEGYLSEDGFYVLLAALINAVPLVSNTSGTYGAYLKYWERRALKPLRLQVPDLLLVPGHHRAFRQDANELAAALDVDILYLDPPYNARQYPANYHLLETIASWDNPKVRGVAGLPSRPEISSRYCRRDAASALEELVRTARSRHILLSYNSEGLIPGETIKDILSTRGKVTVREMPYRRFRSDSDRPGRVYKSDAVFERLYHVALT